MRVRCLGLDTYRSNIRVLQSVVVGRAVHTYIWQLLSWRYTLLDNISRCFIMLEVQVYRFELVGILFKWLLAYRSNSKVAQLNTTQSRDYLQWCGRDQNPKKVPQTNSHGVISHKPSHQQTERQQYQFFRCLNLCVLVRWQQHGAAGTRMQHTPCNKVIHNPRCAEHLISSVQLLWLQP